MSQILAIAGGGAFGAVLRYWVSTTVYAVLGRGFPYGTLVANVLGSFLMGALFVLLLEREVLAPQWRAGILIGVLGAFTTFSTFSIETLNLIQQGEMAKAGVNVAASVVLCLFAAWAGFVLARQI